MVDIEVPWLDMILGRVGGILHATQGLPLRTSASPTMVISRSFHQLGYQIYVLKVLHRNFSCIFSYRVCDAGNKSKFPLWSLYDLLHANCMELWDQ